MDKSNQVALMYLITHLGLIFFTFPANIISSSSQGQWFPILIGFSFHILMITVFMKGLSYFRNQDIVDIIAGASKILAVVILLPTLLYLLLTSVVMLRAYSEIISIIFLSNTPLWAISALILFISSYIASRGLESIFRTAILIAMLFLPLLTVVFLTSVQNSDWRYVFPLMDVDFSFFRKRPYYDSFFAFSGGYLFLGFVQPSITYKKKSIFAAALLLLPFYIFAVYIPILTFGANTASTFVFPYVVAVDTVNLDWLMFDRVTVFFLLSVITFIMMVLAMIMWKTTRILSTCLPKLKQFYLILIITAVVFGSILIIPGWDELQGLFGWNMYLRFYVLNVVPFSILYLGYRSKRKMTHENA